MTTHRTAKNAPVPAPIHILNLVAVLLRGLTLLFARAKWRDLSLLVLILVVLIMGYWRAIFLG
jgi:hypothetical protein